MLALEGGGDDGRGGCKMCSTLFASVDGHSGRKVGLEKKTHYLLSDNSGDSVMEMGNLDGMMVRVTDEAEQDSDCDRLGR